MKDPTVNDIKKAIMDIQAFSQSELCPEWATVLVREMGRTLESIVCARECALNQSKPQRNLGPVCPICERSIRDCSCPKVC